MTTSSNVSLQRVRESETTVAGYLAYRIRVAATGIVLVAALFAVTQSAWLKDPNSEQTWKLWGASSAVGDFANWAVFVLIVTLVLATVAAIEALWGWALAAAISGAGLFVMMQVLAAMANDQTTSDASGATVPLFTTTGAFNEAWLLSVLLAIWGLVVMRTAWVRRDECAWAFNPHMS